MADLKNTAKDAIDQAACKVKDAATDAANYVSEQSKKMANSASAGLSSAKSYVDERANEATSGIASGLRNAGEAVQQWSSQTGPLAETTRGVGQRLSSSGDYLERSGLSGVEDDLVSLMRKNPIQSLLVGIGVGYLLAHLFRSRR